MTTLTDEKQAKTFRSLLDAYDRWTYAPVLSDPIPNQPDDPGTPQEPEPEPESEPEPNEPSALAQVPTKRATRKG